MIKEFFFFFIWKKGSEGASNLKKKKKKKITVTNRVHEKDQKETKEKKQITSGEDFTPKKNLFTDPWVV